MEELVPAIIMFVAFIRCKMWIKARMHCCKCLDLRAFVADTSRPYSPIEAILGMESEGRQSLRGRNCSQSAHCHLRRIQSARQRDPGMVETGKAGPDTLVEQLVGSTDVSCVGF